MTNATLSDEYRTAVLAGDFDSARRIEAALDAQDVAAAEALNRPGVLAEAAAWYASQGVAVFPLRPATKEPHEGTRGFLDATADVDKVRRLWRKYPESNIGAPTGITFDVIDVDGPKGVTSWLGVDGFAGSLPPFLGHVLTSRPEGGGHHLYVPVTGLGNKVNLFPGVDYRGKGGYVVVPPSVTAQGRRWRWLRPLQSAS